MWSPKRNKQVGTAKPVPKEEYQKQRMWLVWLVSIATFVLTVLIVLGVFWLGRWGWHQVHHKQKPVPVTTQPAVKAGDSQNANSGAAKTTSGTNSAPASNAPATISTGPASTPPATTSTSPQKLVNTGPDSDE